MPVNKTACIVSGNEREGEEGEEGLVMTGPTISVLFRQGSVTNEKRVRVELLVDVCMDVVQGDDVLVNEIQSRPFVDAVDPNAIHHRSAEYADIECSR
jgi:hypothetical protein